MEIASHAAASAENCFHCGLPVPVATAFGFESGGTWRAFCCAGCEAVSRAIAGLGLDDYYRLRTSAGTGEATAAAANVPDGDSEDLASFDDPAVQSRFVRTAPDGSREAEL